MRKIPKKKTTQTGTRVPVLEASGNLWLAGHRYLAAHQIDNCLRAFEGFRSHFGSDPSLCRADTHGG